MNLKEAAEFLGWRPEAVKAAAINGVQLPKSKNRIKLRFTEVAGALSFEDDGLDEFIASFEAEEPGRHPPIAVRRLLLVEAWHRCAVCRDAAPLEYHHILEFAELKHHDAHHMIAVCATCHSRMTVGQIDEKSQRVYKEKLLNLNALVPFSATAADFLSSQGPLRFQWEDLREIVDALHDSLSANDDAEEATSKFDLDAIAIDEKNTLNGLSAEYFIAMRDHHEPYFSRLHQFLSDPINWKVRDRYFEVVDELRMKIAAGRDDFRGFEHAMLRFVELARDQRGVLENKRKTLSVLLSFMYFNCDIGRKS